MVTKVLITPEGASVSSGVPARDSLLAKYAGAGLGAGRVSSDPPETLPSEAELALAWSSPKVRGSLSIALHLDRRLARIVARTSEPMLGQMRLAWWRESLAKPVAQRPRGDEVLDAIGREWAGREAALTRLIDGWEALVTADRMGQDEAAAFGAARGAFFAALVPAATLAVNERLETAGFRWAIADAATRVSDADERAAMIAAGLSRAEGGGRVPANLRGIAVLEALALRAMRRGGRPLMEGRGASLAALKVAIFLN